METLLVRLRPLDRRGTTPRCYSYRGIRFHIDRGWYRVPTEIAEYLRTVRTIDTDPNAPRAFDVADDDTAQRVDAEEQAKAQAARATAPIATEPRAAAAAAPAAGSPPAAPDARRAPGKKE
jgi:uncharacterized membrane protein